MRREVELVGLILKPNIRHHTLLRQGHHLPCTSHSPLPPHNSTTCISERGKKSIINKIKLSSLRLPADATLSAAQSTCTSFKAPGMDSSIRGKPSKLFYINIPKLLLLRYRKGSMERRQWSLKRAEPYYFYPAT